MGSPTDLHSTWMNRALCDNLKKAILRWNQDLPFDGDGVVGTDNWRVLVPLRDCPKKKLMRQAWGPSPASVAPCSRRDRSSCPQGLPGGKMRCQWEHWAHPKHSGGRRGPRHRPVRLQSSHGWRLEDNPVGEWGSHMGTCNTCKSSLLRQLRPRVTITRNLQFSKGTFILTFHEVANTSTSNNNMIIF